MSQIAKLLSQVIKAIDAEDSKVRQDLLDGKFTNTLAFTRDKEHFLKHRHHAFAECKSANGDVFYVDYRNFYIRHSFSYIRHRNF